MTSLKRSFDNMYHLRLLQEQLSMPGAQGFMRLPLGESIGPSLARMVAKHRPSILAATGTRRIAWGATKTLVGESLNHIELCTHVW